MMEQTLDRSGTHASPRTLLLPALLAGLAAFAASTLWYSPLLFGDLLRSLDASPPPPQWALLVAPLREVAAAYVVAHLIRGLALYEPRRAAGLGAGLWLAFHAVMMSGAVLFSGMDWRVAAVHGGDWLMKLLLLSTVLALWLGRGRRGR